MLEFTFSQGNMRSDVINYIVVCPTHRNAEVALESHGLLSLRYAVMFQ
jgi:hypothetical protein